MLRAPGPKDERSTILQLERDVPELMKKSNVPGVSIAMIRRGKTIWVHGFGVKEAGTNQPVIGETVFEAASLSKPVFAYGVLKLVDQGKRPVNNTLAEAVYRGRRAARKDYSTDCLEPSDRISELAKWRLAPDLLLTGRAV